MHTGRKYAKNKAKMWTCNDCLHKYKWNKNKTTRRKITKWIKERAMAMAASWRHRRCWNRRFSLWTKKKRRRNFLNEAAAPGRVEASLHQPHLTSPVSAQFVSEMCLNKGSTKMKRHGVNDQRSHSDRSRALSLTDPPVLVAFLHLPPPLRGSQHSHTDREEVWPGGCCPARCWSRWFRCRLLARSSRFFFVSFSSASVLWTEAASSLARARVWSQMLFLARSVHPLTHADAHRSLLEVKGARGYHLATQERYSSALMKNKMSDML